MGKLAQLFSGNIGDMVAQIVGVFKLSPEQAAQHSEQLAKIAQDAVNKQIEATQTEMDSAKQVILAEANSQSWLPRNVRPLLLLMWGLTMTLNVWVPLIAHFWVKDFPVMQIPDWLYKLTAIGFTGYVTARTWEKVTDTDK